MPQDHKYKIERVAEDAPDRCQGVTAHGQCTFRQMDGIKYCAMHAGGARISLQKEQRRKYRVEQWQKQLDEHADDSEIKNLREEIGVLRLLIQKKLEFAKTNEELMLHSSSLSILVTQLSRLVQDAHKLEKSIGELLDRKQLAELMDKILLILVRHISDPTTLELIASELGELQ